MFKEPKETKYAGKGLLKKKYLACINGPILYTAPHSKRLYRGGPEYGEKVRVHEREMFVAYLAAYFANSSGNSFCVWGKAGVMNEEDIDPNYML